MSTRYFGWWCLSCPTRVVGATESAEDYPAAPQCPMCGGEMEDSDILTGTERIPYHAAKIDSPEAPAIHAALLASGRAG